MKKYLVVDVNDANYSFIVDDLKELINEMYEVELLDNDYEVAKGWFFNNFKVFVSESDIIELDRTKIIK